jgi:hypothetical protein
MKPLRGVVWACALALVGASAEPVHAAWCNVFQVCCNSCGGSSSVSNYAAPACCDPCPQPTCTTRYVQRCYYQPVTSYTTKTYYEPVTTYRTSYYYEPVTSYRYSCYVDPCTGCSHQVACPTTCYRLRSQCCPVQSWAQRCCQVPVTTYQQSFYYEPVTTCCTPPAPTCCPTAYNPPCPPAASAAVPQGTYSAPPSGASSIAPYTPPAVTEQNASPGVREYPDASKTPSGSPLYDRYYPAPQTPTMPPASGAALRPAAPRLPVVPPAPVPVAPPAVKLERIVAGPAAQLQGQVVSNDNAPRAGARVMFVSAARQGPQSTVTADTAGKFRVTLASGGWLVYVKGVDDKPVFYSKIDVRDNENRQVTLVSR